MMWDRSSLRSECVCVYVRSWGCVKERDLCVTEQWGDSVEWCIAAASGQDTSHSLSSVFPINVSAWSENTKAHWATEDKGGFLRRFTNFHQLGENIIADTYSAYIFTSPLWAVSILKKTLKTIWLKLVITARLKEKISCEAVKKEMAF